MNYLKITVILLVSAMVAPEGVSAQFLGGFFNQQSTREKLMAEQIAGLEVYLQTLKGGYHICDQGLTTAHELKGGTYQLHTGYFQSLEQVSTVIRDNPKGKQIAALQQQIVAVFTSEISWQQQQHLLQANELSYLQQVYNNLLKQSQVDMAELTDVLTPGKLQLSDQQRLARLDHIYESMKDKYAFTGYFTAKCRKLAFSRRRSQQENNQLKQLYGIQ